MTFHIALVIDENGIFYLHDNEDGLGQVDKRTQERLDEIFELNEED